MEHKILIVEDEQNLGNTLLEYLESKNFSVVLATSAKQAESIFQSQSISIVLMDIGLPDGNGIELARTFRKKNDKFVLLFISALNDPATRLEGLEIGAEDYITKPFELKELQLRLSRILKSKDMLNANPDQIDIGKLKIFFKSFYVVDAFNKQITLNQKECAILELLWRKQNEVVSRDQIIEDIWGKDSFPSNRTVDNYIVGLRKWCETDSDALTIETIRGIGYKLTKKI